VRLSEVAKGGQLPDIAAIFVRVLLDLLSQQGERKKEEKGEGRDVSRPKIRQDLSASKSLFWRAVGGGRGSPRSAKSSSTYSKEEVFQERDHDSLSSKEGREKEKGSRHR